MAFSGLLARLKIDTDILAILGLVALASVRPAQGEAARDDAACGS